MTACVEKIVGGWQKMRARVFRRRVDGKRVRGYWWHSIPFSCAYTRVILSGTNTAEVVGKEVHLSKDGK